MKNSHARLLAAGLILMAQTGLAQRVKLANVALGMNEAEVNVALARSTPRYVHQVSDSQDLYYLVAESEEESFAFTFIYGRVVAFSLMHLLPAGQQPYLPAGQDPTPNALRNLVIKQTWTPAAIQKGDTLWFSDVEGAPMSDASHCIPKAAEPWIPFGPIPNAKAADSGLLKPSLVSYPASCGVSIRLHMAPAESENDRVAEVRIQVLDMNAINAFFAKSK